MIISHYMWYMSHFDKSTLIIWAYMRYPVNSTLVIWYFMIHLGKPTLIIWHFMALFNKDMTLMTWSRVLCILAAYPRGFYDVYDTNWHYLACLMSLMSPIRFCDHLWYLCGSLWRDLTGYISLMSVTTEFQIFGSWRFIWLYMRLQAKGFMVFYGVFWQGYTQANWQ
jgi:hypothetical protein